MPLVLAGVVAALLALLFLFAAWPLLRGIANALAGPLEGLPFGIADRLRNAVGNLAPETVSWALSAVGVAEDLLMAFSGAARDLFNQSTEWQRQVTAALVRIVVAYLPQQLALAKAYADRQAWTAIQYALGAYERAHAEILAASVADRAYADQQAWTAIQYALGAYARAHAELQSAEVALRQYTDHAELRALQAAAGAYARAHSEIGAAVAALQGYVDRTAAGLRGDLLELERTFQLDLGRLGQQEQAYTDQKVAAAAGALALGLSAVQARVQSVEQSDCYRQCLPLGRLGGNLMAADAMLLIILGSALAADPKATTRAVEATLGPLVADAQQLYRSMFGAR